MSRPVVVSLVFSALLQAAFAVTTVDISKTKNIEIQLTDEDVVPKTALKNLTPEMYNDPFIGDLEVGRRHTDETVMRRVIVFDNPTNTVQSTRLVMQTRGNVHYVSVENQPGSYAVICSDPRTLGSATSIINIRAGPNSTSKLNLILASGY